MMRQLCALNVGIIGTEMISENSFELEETHPDWFYDIPEMKCLIVGSFPPHEDKRDFNFYYPNTQNRFWDVLALIAGHELKFFSGDDAVKERICIMEKLNVGIQNLGRIIKRKGKSASDKDIKIIECYDILNIVENHPSLSTIILTGYSDTNSSYKCFKRYLKKEKVRFKSTGLVKAGHQFDIYFGRPIRCVVLNSTSSRAAGLIEMDELVSQFRTAIEQS